MHRSVEQPNDLMYRADRRTAIFTPVVCHRVPASSSWMMSPRLELSHGGAQSRYICTTVTPFSVGE